MPSLELLVCEDVPKNSSITIAVFYNLSPPSGLDIEKMIPKRLSKDHYHLKNSRKAIIHTSKRRTSFMKFI